MLPTVACLLRPLSEQIIFICCTLKIKKRRGDFYLISFFGQGQQSSFASFGLLVDLWDLQMCFVAKGWLYKRFPWKQVSGIIFI